VYMLYVIHFNVFLFDSLLDVHFVTTKVIFNYELQVTVYDLQGIANYELCFNCLRIQSFKR